MVHLSAVRILSPNGGSEPEGFTHVVAGILAWLTLSYIGRCPSLNVVNWVWLAQLLRPDSNFSAQTLSNLSLLVSIYIYIYVYMED